MFCLHWLIMVPKASVVHIIFCLVWFLLFLNHIYLCGGKNMYVMEVRVQQSSVLLINTSVCAFTCRAIFPTHCFVLIIIITFLVIEYVWVHAHAWRWKLVLSFHKTWQQAPFPYWALSLAHGSDVWEALDNSGYNDSKHVSVPRLRYSLQNSGCISSLRNSICPPWKFYYKHIPYS